MPLTLFNSSLSHRNSNNQTVLELLIKLQGSSKAISFVSTVKSSVYFTDAFSNYLRDIDFESLVHAKETVQTKLNKTHKAYSPSQYQTDPKASKNTAPLQVQQKIES